MTTSEAVPRTGREQDFRAVLWVASLPLLFGGLMVAVMFGAGLLNLRLHAVVVDWGLIGVFGHVVFLPLWLLAWAGAAALGKRFWIGRLIVSATSLATLSWFAASAYGEVQGALHPDARDPDSWWMSLTIGEAVVFAVPFAAMAVANLWLLARLWRRRTSAGS